MEHISFEGVNLAELLPRIPDSIKDGLPFGLVKLDLTGTILEYNMAEGELTGVDPKWAIGKNFFDDVALCTKTQAFYGRFVDGVKKGFLNVVFDYTFDHREEATRVKVHMVTIPNHLGQKNVMILVKRSDKPLVMDAAAEPTDATPVPVVDTRQHSPEAQNGTMAAQTASTGQGTASIQDIVNAVVIAMNQNTNVAGKPAPLAPASQLVQPSRPRPSPAPAPSPSPSSAPLATPAPSPKTGSRHEDILKF
jgi:photoactive yellow protein